MKKYDQYKNSGVEWLGEIPKHWKILPGLSFIYENKDRNKGMIRNTVLSLSYGKIRVKGENELTGLVPESFETYQFVNKGDLIFRPTDLQNDTVSLRSSISEYEGIITNAYLNLRFRSKANSKFYHYFFRSIDNNKIIYGLGSGLRQNISYLDFRRFQFPFPPIEEQIAIANFLDDKTTKIDQAIAIKQKQIELLKERKQIIIQEAVTRGLNENVKLKDSGVEWIGEIPEHWEVRRFKFLCHITTGSKNTEDKVDNGKYPFYVRSQKPERINSYTFDGEAILTAGDGAGVGKVFHYLNEKFDFHQRVYKFSNFKHIKGKLLYYYIKNNFHNVALNGEAKSTVDSLRLPLIQNFLVTLPPIEEQIEIINRIETTNKKIATAISLKEQEIEKLKEYKMSLIDGVVTGKVKVC
jgi:type I restriction enzyme S subunit